MSGKPLRKSPIVLFLTTVIALTGCSATVDVEAAPNAADPGCAHTMIGLPDELTGLDKRRTNAQATAAWGEPTEIVLRCGAEDPGVSSDLCVTANGVDWLTREGEDGIWTMISYGRSPVIEVFFNPEEVSSSTVMTELAGPVSVIEATKFCSNTEYDVDLSETQTED